jgi:hypothetical protein
VLKAERWRWARAITRSADAEGFPHQRISEQLDAGLDAVGAILGLAAEVLGRFVEGGILDRVGRLAGDPMAVGLHHRQEPGDDLLALGRVGQGLQAHRHSGRC